MKIYNTQPANIMSPGAARTSVKARLVTIVAILLVLLVAAISVAAYGRVHPYPTAQAPLPPVGNWTPVLDGYNVTSLTAVKSDPAVLYACVVRVQPAPGVSGQSITRKDVTGAHFTVLRSADYGAHWQDIASNAGLVGNCQLAVNPDNAQELYLVTHGQYNGQVASSLKHSTDAGKSWTSIQPTLKLPPAHLPWDIQQMSMVGGHLFGLQRLAQQAIPTSGQTLPRFFPTLNRLVTSVDSGQTWTVLDQQFSTNREEARAYAIDPANLSTLYELVGQSWLPYVRSGITSVNLPIIGVQGELYKSTDNGASWHLLLKGLPFGAKMQLVDSKLLYAGGANGPMPLPYMLTNQQASNSPPMGSFQLHVSNDGGASWQDVAQLPLTSRVQSWFVGADGLIYAYTVKPDYPRVPASTPDVSPAPTAVTTIQRYDPATHAWSQLTSASTGLLIALTPGSAQQHALLWLLSMNKGSFKLYRYVV